MSDDVFFQLQAERDKVKRLSKRLNALQREVEALREREHPRRTEGAEEWRVKYWKSDRDREMWKERAQKAERLLREREFEEPMDLWKLRRKLEAAERRAESAESQVRMLENLRSMDELANRLREGLRNNGTYPDDDLRRLIFLAHPDKWDNHPLATQMTQELNAMRDRTRKRMH